MTPALPGQNTVHGALGYPISQRQFVRTERGLKPPHFNNARFVHFGHWMKGAFMVPASPSALCDSIELVVRICSQEQMTWIDAGRIVTFVADLQPGPNFSEVDQPRRLVTTNAAASACMKPAISIAPIIGAHPQPACIEFGPDDRAVLVDIFPKTISHRCRPRRNRVKA